MDILLVRYIENLDNLLSIYLTVKAGGTWPYAVALIVPGVDNDPIINKILSFVFTPRGVELTPTQDIFISNLLRIINENFQTSVKANFDDTKTIKLLALIALILALFAAYIFIWVPYITLLNHTVFVSLIFSKLKIIGLENSIYAFDDSCFDHYQSQINQRLFTKCY